MVHLCIASKSTGSALDHVKRENPKTFPLPAQRGFLIPLVLLWVLARPPWIRTALEATLSEGVERRDIVDFLGAVLSWAWSNSILLKGRSLLGHQKVVMLLLAIPSFVTVSKRAFQRLPVLSNVAKWRHFGDLKAARENLTPCWWASLGLVSSPWTSSHSRPYRRPASGWDGGINLGLHKPGRLRL